MKILACTTYFYLQFLCAYCVLLYVYALHHTLDSSRTAGTTQPHHRLLSARYVSGWSADEELRVSRQRKKDAMARRNRVWWPPARLVDGVTSALRGMVGGSGSGGGQSSAAAIQPQRLQP